MTPRTHPASAPHKPLFSRENDGFSSARLGFGSGPLGGFADAAVDDATAHATLLAAWEEGVRAFDTAPWYGLGAAEQRLGRFLSGVPRGSFMLSTKVGRVLRAPSGRRGVRERSHWTNALPLEWRFDYRRDGVLRSFESSGERLGVQRFDALLIRDLEPAGHGDTLTTRLEELERGGGFAALEELRSRGAVGAVGLAVNQAQAVAPLLARYDLDLVLLAGCYTLLDTSALDEALPLCLERGVSVVIGGAFNSGILVTGPIPGATYDYGRPPDSVLARVRRLGEIALRHGVKLGAAAIRFPLAHPAVSSVIVGAASPEQIREDIRLSGCLVPDGFWTELRRERLLRGDAPVPGGLRV